MKLLLILALMAFSSCSKRTESAPETPVELTDYSSLREKAVKRMQGGELKPDNSGVVILPQNLKMASVDGRAYVSSSPTTGQLIAFKSIGGSNFSAGILYAEKGLDKESVNIQVGPLRLAVRGKIDEHWYRVGR